MTHRRHTAPRGHLRSRRHAADPLLDFDAIRAEIGLAPGCPSSSSWTDAEPGDAGAGRGDHARGTSARPSRGATLTDGCAELLGHLTALEIPTAILTRNIREVVDPLHAGLRPALPRRLHARGRSAQAFARRRAEAVRGTRRRARRHADRRRLQVRRPGRAHAGCRTALLLREPLTRRRAGGVGSARPGDPLAARAAAAVRTSLTPVSRQRLQQLGERVRELRPWP